MHHHFAAGSLSRHNLVVFVFVFRARSNAITGHVLTLSRIKKGLVNPREGAENPLQELTKRTPREAARHGMAAAGLGARSEGQKMRRSLWFFFSEPRFPENSEILQKSIPSPAHLRDQRKERLNAACTSHARIQQSQERDATDGLGVIRQIARTGVALGCGREIKRLRHALPWRLLWVARKELSLVV